MDRSSVDDWLEAYIDAWKTYDRNKIASLLAPDVEYRYDPYTQPVRGREAVVTSVVGRG